MSRERAWAAPAAVLALAAARFHEYVLGGSVSFRDAGTFFVPLRLEVARLLAGGELPLWTDRASNGRALAADPNAAVFWPLTPLVPLVGTTGLMLLSVGAALLLFLAALRRLGLSRGAAAAGTAVLLFSGVFQTLPLLFTTLASAAPLPLAVAVLATLDPAAPSRARRRDVALAAACLGLSALGGEPVITLLGGLACAGVLLVRTFAAWRAGGSHPAATLLGAGAVAALLAVALAAVQLLPAAGELARSARGGEMRAEEGALFWSVRPSRLLTLLEPRLSGDPFAERPEEYWGAATFDAGNPYFYDLALGLLPLAFAAAAARDRRGRGALALAAFGALAASGRYLPGFAAVAGSLSFARYPEKAWLLSTFALAAAAAVGADLAWREEGDGPARRLLRRTAGLLALALLVGAAAARLLPGPFHDALWSLRLGAGPAPASVVSRLVFPLLLAGGAACALLALLVRVAARGGVAPRGAAAVVAALFLLDGARRVEGSCPAGPADRFSKATEEVERAVAAAGAGRFYDDGADARAVAVRRAAERDGFDPLRPLTGTVFGIRYAGENDVDRMTARQAVAFARRLAGEPWGEEKVALLRAAGVTLARTSSEAEVPATRDVWRRGPDRLVAIAGARPEASLVPRALVVARGAGGPLPAGADPLEAAVVEGDDPPGWRSFGTGTVRVTARTSSRLSLHVTAGEPGGLLVLTRSYDPTWRARVGSKEVPTRRADGHLTAIVVPAGESKVELAYRNPLLAAGAGLSLLAVAVLAILAAPALRSGRRGRLPRPTAPAAGAGS